MAVQFTSGQKPVTATHPVQAAKRLRIVMKTALYLSRNGGGGKTAQLALRHSQQYWRRYARDAVTRARPQLELVEVALRERKTAPGLEALRLARQSLSKSEEYLRSLEVDLDSRLSAFTTENEDEEQFDDDGNEIERADGDLRSLLSEAYQLVQCFPTVEDLPKTDAENTLRAIIALLRNHRWPGVEGLTQTSGKEVEDGEASLSGALAQLAEAAGKPEPVGSEPVF